MKPERWKVVDSLLGLALDQPQEERARILAQACGQDEVLLAEARSLLQADDEATGFLSEKAKAVSTHSPGPLRKEIGAYQLREIIGEGGMGRVYKAELSDGSPSKPVALKLLKAEGLSENWRRRFRTERHVLGRLKHPHISTLIGGGHTEDNEPYLVMELVEGRSITRHCREEKLDVKECLHLLEKVCGAVGYAHQNLVVHRDLKPGNVLVDEQGEPRLLDFGIAKLLEPEMFDVTVEATRWPERLMSPDWASPEQISGSSITPATDVWALGALAYEMLTGERPYRSSRDLAELAAIRRIVPRAPSQVEGIRWGDGQFGDDLDRVVLKALRMEPERRYLDGLELSADLRRLLEGSPVQAKADSIGYQASLLVELLVDLLGEAKGKGIFEGVDRWGILALRDWIAGKRTKGQAELVRTLLTQVYHDLNYSEENLRKFVDAFPVFGMGTPRTLSDAFWELGKKEKDAGRFNQAEAYFQKALAISVELEGKNNPMAAAILRNLEIVEGESRTEEQARMVFGEDDRSKGTTPEEAEVDSED